MNSRDLSFVIPTYRLRDVSETVEQYDQHFWKNGHALNLIVFDDSSPANQLKYFELLERTRTHNDLYYVGPQEKEQFLAYLNGRLTFRNPRVPGWVDHLTVLDLEVRGAKVDLSIVRHAEGVVVRVLRNDDSVDVVLDQSSVVRRCV